MIAAAPTLKRQRQLRRRDVLPPLELEASAPRRPRQAAILPQHARRLRRQQRFYQAVKLLLILLGIAAMAGWMKNWQS